MARTKEEKEKAERENKLIGLLEEQKREREREKARKEETKQDISKWGGYAASGGFILLFIAMGIGAPSLLPVGVIIIVVGLIITFIY